MQQFKTLTLYTMKKILVALLLGTSMTSFAEDLKLTVPELEPKLVYSETESNQPDLHIHEMEAEAMAASHKW